MYWINSTFIKSNIYFNDLKIINNKVEASCKICRKKIIAGISSSSNLRRHYKTVNHTKLDEYDRVKCEHNDNSKKDNSKNLQNYPILKILNNLHWFNYQSSNLTNYY